MQVILSGILLAEISGTRNGQELTQSFPMKRVKYKASLPQLLLIIDFGNGTISKLVLIQSIVYLN